MAKVNLNFNSEANGPLTGVSGFAKIGSTGNAGPNVLNNAVNPIGGYAQVLYTDFTPEGSDYYIQGEFTVGAHGNSAGGLAICAGDPSYAGDNLFRNYSVWWNNGKFELVYLAHKWASPSVLATYTVPVIDADDPSANVVTVKLERKDDDLNVYINGAERISVTDTTIPVNGYAGFSWDFNGSTGIWDNIEIGDWEEPVTIGEASDIETPVTPGAEIGITGTNLNLVTAVNLSDGVESVSQSFVTNSATDMTVTVNQADLPFTDSIKSIDLVLTSQEGSIGYPVQLVPNAGHEVIEIGTPSVNGEYPSLFDNYSAGDPALVEQILAPAQSDNGHLITYNDDGTFEIAAGTGGDGLTGVRYWDGEWSNPVNHSIVEIDAEPEEPPEDPEEEVTLKISKGLLKPLLKALTRAI